MAKSSVKSGRSESSLEALLALQLRALKLPQPLRNYRFLPDRKYEFDFCWLDVKLAVEVQGMAHRIKAKFEADLEKRALALLAGWTVLEVGGKQVRSGQAIAWLEVLMARCLCFTVVNTSLQTLCALAVARSGSVGLSSIPTFP